MLVTRVRVIAAARMKCGGETPQDRETGADRGRKQSAELNNGSSTRMRMCAYLRIATATGSNLSQFKNHGIRGIVCSSETSIDLVRGSEIAKGLMGGNTAKGRLSKNPRL